MDFLDSADTEFQNLTFKRLNHDKKIIEAREFYDCTFENCSFVEAAFRDCRFLGCKFKKCDLSLVSVHGSIFRDAHFENSQAIGINWTDASWPKRGFFNRLKFFECALNYSTFIGLTLKEIHIVECTARDVDFAEADLTQANCTDTDFSESRFWKTNLTEADFTGARNYAIHVGLNTLKKTKFSLPEAMSLLYSLDIILVDDDE